MYSACMRQQYCCNGNVNGRTAVETSSCCRTSPHAVYRSRLSCGTVASKVYRYIDRALLVVNSRSGSRCINSYINRVYKYNLQAVHNRHYLSLRGRTDCCTALLLCCTIRLRGNSSYDRFIIQVLPRLRNGFILCCYCRCVWSQCGNCWSNYECSYLILIVFIRVGLLCVRTGAGNAAVFLLVYECINFDSSTRSGCGWVYTLCFSRLIFFIFLERFPCCSLSRPVRCILLPTP